MAQVIDVYCLTTIFRLFSFFSGNYSSKNSMVTIIQHHLMNLNVFNKLQIKIINLGYRQCYSNDK